MTSIAELRSHAHKTGFVKNALNHDFVCGPNGLWFFRLRNDYLDFFGFYIGRSRIWANVPVTCFKRDLIRHCDMNFFPKGFDADIPILSESSFHKNTGVGIGFDPWRIETRKDIENTFTSISKLLKNKVNDWFLRIDTDEKLWESLPLSVKESEAGRKYHIGLFGKPPSYK